MSLVELLLKDSEKSFKEVIRTQAPLFYTIPVHRAEPDPKNERHWSFYTDLKSIHMDVFKPELIEKVFNGIIKGMYQDAYGTVFKDSESLVKRLIHDNFLYLHMHEILHPWKCPDSKNDEKLVDKAIYEGILEMNKGASKESILKKVGNCRNAIWDQTIDGAFYNMTNNSSRFDSRLCNVLKDSDIPANDVNHLPDGVIPIFDVIELELTTKKFDSMFYPLTRAVYALSFTSGAKMRTKVFDYFKNKILGQMKKEEFDGVMQSALKGFISDISDSTLKFYRIDRESFNEDVTSMYLNYNNPDFDNLHSRTINTITDLLLNKNTRYDSMKGFIKPLAKYISESQTEKRHGTHEGQGSGDGESKPQNGQGNNTEQALMNLSEILGQQQGNSLLSEIANSGQDSGGKDSRLSNIAKDEYYKRNAKEINMRSPDYKAVQFSLGKKLIPELESTTILLSEDVVNLNLDQIMEFQQKTGITQLFQLSEGQYRYDHYIMKEIEEADYRYENQGIEVPDNIVFIDDSSGSMGNPNYVATGCKYDILKHVEYGILKTMIRFSKDMNKDINIVTANFSSKGNTRVSKPLMLSEMYNSRDNDAKNTLMMFQNNVTFFDVNKFDDIENALKPGKTIYIWNTDGGIDSECHTEVLNRIKKVSSNKDTCFLYFEVGGESSFGRDIEKLAYENKNVHAYLDTTIHAIQDSALEILVDYRK